MAPTLLANLVRDAAAHVSYTDPSLLTNLVCRVLFGFLANLACWVPLRLLYKNGEFAAVVLIVTVMALNFLTIINALIWRDNDVARWWLGYGWCDFNNYFYNPLILVYTGCILAIMRNLAIQLGSLRANPVSGGEKKRRNLVQALIIFPVPLIQLAWIYPLMTQRYAIGTLVGCTWLNDNSWPYVLFFVVPAPTLAIATAWYAILTYARFRQIQKTTASALSSNQLAAARAQRASRRLFMMTLAILVPYLPLTCVYAALNVQEVLPLSGFDFGRIHRFGTWNTIAIITSDQIDFSFMNANYIPILTAVPIFWFFGMTKDAINTYRRYLLAAGLGRVFPSLGREYDPDSKLYGTGTGAGTGGTVDDVMAKKLAFPQSESGSDADTAKGQSRLSKLMWTMFGFGRRRSDFDHVSSQEIGSAVGRRGPTLFGGLGSTTRRLNSVAPRPATPSQAHHSRVGPAAAAAAAGRELPDSPASLLGTPKTAKPQQGSGSAGWPSPSRSDFQTRIWSGDESPSKTAAVVVEHTESKSVQSGKGVVVTEHIASETARV